MACEAVNYNEQGLPLSDVRALFDRAWVLNGYEQTSFPISLKKELARLEHYTPGNHLVITDDQLPIWGGPYDTPQSRGTNGIVGVNAYSGEIIFQQRPARAEIELKGSPGEIYRQIITEANSVSPYRTLLRPNADIYEGGPTRTEMISTKPLYEDVQRISDDSGEDWWVLPVVENGRLHYEGHWEKKRGRLKNFVLEEGVNVERNDKIMEIQGTIWNYIMAFGDGATDADRPHAIAFDQASIDKFGARVYALAVSSSDQATVEAAARAFLAENAWPRNTFNLVVGGRRVSDVEKNKAFNILRIGDTLGLKLYPVKDGHDINVDTQVRILGMVHRGKRNVLELTADEVRP